MAMMMSKPSLQTHILGLLLVQHEYDDDCCCCLVWQYVLLSASTVVVVYDQELAEACLGQGGTTAHQVDNLLGNVGSKVNGDGLWGLELPFRKASDLC